MRALFSIVGLLAVLLIVLLLMRQQTVSLPATTPTAAPAQQARQIEQQVRDDLERALAAQREALDRAEQEAQ